MRLPAIQLSDVPALISAERQAIAAMTEPAEVAVAEKRAAAIADLTKRAGLAVPIQNEATFLRAEALERLAVLVDESRNGYHHGSPEIREINRRVSEGRAIAQTGVLDRMRELATPDRAVSMGEILKQAKRSQREAATKERRDEAEAEARAAGLSCNLVCADLREWRPEGVAAIVTDPPYVGDSLPLYEALADFAFEVLPDGGALIVMTWQAILADVMGALSRDGLAYRWCICWKYGTSERVMDHKRRVFPGWKPVLVYHRGAMPADATVINDVVVSEDADKVFHEWGQSLEGFKRLVRGASEPGDVVCDPFLGGGTTAVAALAQGRSFIGCDIDPAAIETTRGRVT